MKKTIDELATDYIRELAGTNPNADLSAFSDDYRAFLAGANAVKNNVGLADVMHRRELLVAFYRSIEGGDYLYPDECDMHVDDFLESN